MIGADYDYLFKILLIGNSGVGKSSLLTQFTDQKFRNNSLTTIGVDFRIVTYKTNDNKIIKLQVWDTSGQIRYSSITNSYYRGSNGIIMVFDVTDRVSFTNLESYWIEQIGRYCTKRLGDDLMPIPILLVGNKSDLVDRRDVSYQEAMEFANSFEIEYIETSAKENTNVEKSFHRLATKIRGYFNRQLEDKEKEYINLNNTQKVSRCNCS